MNRNILFTLLTIFSINCSYQPSQANLNARKWFQDARFGLFIHWGIYSQLAQGEWVLEKQKIPLKNYEKLAPLFNPIKFSAREWVSLAKAAGMKYITITTKHHDGFAMFGTKQNSWNIVDGTPYGRDILKELAQECAKQDIKLFLYYSQLDWHHQDYYPRGWTGNNQDSQSRTGDWPKYISFMNNQLTELLTNYGKIAGIWFDGWWDKPTANWDLQNTFKLIHDLQPHALIGSNHHDRPFEGQDFQMFEQNLPGQNKTDFGFDETTHISKLPLETCLTINKSSWGVNLVDKKNGFKTIKELIESLVGSAGRNANLLLNVGPLADGTFPEEAQKLLKEMGRWLSANGESIYGTHGGPLEPRSWGVTTQRDNKIYVHLLNWHAKDAIWLPVNSVKKVYYLNTKQAVSLEIRSNAILLKDLILTDPYDTVIVLEK